VSLNATVLLNFGDVSNITKQTSCFSVLLGAVYRISYRGHWKWPPPLEDYHPPLLMCFFLLFRVFLGNCWQQCVQYCVPVSPSFVIYSNEIFLSEIPTERSLKGWGLEMAVLLNALQPAAKVSMRNNSREWTRVLLVNTPYSYLHSFCEPAVRSGLATCVTLTRVSRKVSGQFTVWGWPCF
jgi:hypothetical protein